MTGTACHRSPRLANQRNSGCSMVTSSTASAGISCSVTGAPGLLHEQRKYVEPAGGWPPGQPRSRASRVRPALAGSPMTAPPDLVARVPDQLRAEDPRPWPVRRVRREHGDHRPDPAAVRRLAQVRDRLGGDVRCRGDLAAVAHPQAPPVQPPDASRAVPPGDTRAEGQLSRSVPVRARRLDLAANVPESAGRAAPRRFSRVEQRDELLGAGQQAVQGGRVIACPGPPAERAQVGGEAGPGFVRRQRASLGGGNTGDSSPCSWSRARPAAGRGQEFASEHPDGLDSGPRRPPG